MIREAVTQKDALQQLSLLLAANKNSKTQFQNLDRGEFLLLSKIIPILNLFDAETKRVNIRLI
jgi:hypothetical protein